MEEEGSKRKKLRIRFINSGSKRIDRISNLPQEIIHGHIFPCLGSKHVKMMSCLSKTWYRLSNSFPYFDFCDSPVAKYKEDDDIDMCLKFIDQTLQKFFYFYHDNQVIRYLSIPFNSHPKATPFLDNWIDLVLQHGIEEFHLYTANPGMESESITINNSDSLMMYDLPSAFFSHANSVMRKASIMGCSLLHSFPSLVPNPNLFLKKLNLFELLMDDAVLNCIISCCPLIEELYIFDCLGISSIVIYSLLKLKRLTLINLVGEISSRQIITVELDSPSLQSVSILGSFNLRIIGYCPLLIDLELWYFVELELQDILSKLPLLRSLSFFHMYLLTNIKLSSDTLNKLKIFSCTSLVWLDINDAPNLVSIKYNNYSAPDLIASSSSAQWDVTTEYSFDNEIPFRTFEDFLVEFSNFVSKMKRVEQLKIYFVKSMGNIKSEELKQKIVQLPVVKLDKLKLWFNEETRDEHLFVLDGVLWMFHPRTLSIEVGRQANKYVVESICKNLCDHYGDGGCCSCTVARRSWLHCLEDVMSVNKDGTENRMTIDGTSQPSKIRSCIMKIKNVTISMSDLYSEVRFIFKW